MQGFNKYYPPDFDPSKHSSLNSYRGKHALGDRARKIDQGVLITRFELPYNIWCGGCNNHIGMGVRYNAEKKKIGNYYSTPIYSFRCKCHLCDNWFTIETDPKNTRYVVTSGARKKEEDWDPEENGGHAIFDTDVKPATEDPLAALEKSTSAQKVAQTVHVPRLEELQAHADKYNADPAVLSSRVRHHFRIEKKDLKRKRDADEALKNKYGLASELALLPDNRKLESAREFHRARLAFAADEDAKRVRVQSELGQPRPRTHSTSSSSSSRMSSNSSTLAMSRSKSRQSLPSAASTLRSKLLESATRKADPFLSSTRSKPPDLGVITKK